MLRPLDAFALALAIGMTSLAGCAPSGEPTDVRESPVVETTDPDYLVFGTADEAGAWFDTLRPYLGGAFGTLGAVLPESDPRIEPLRRTVSAHWAAIVPKFGPDIPAPRVLVVESTAPNAAILIDPVARKLGDVVVVGTALLALDAAHVDAIVAHELGHLVLKNALPAVGQAVKKHYRVTGEEPLGITQTNDPAIAAVITPWALAVSLYGLYAAKELSGLPSGGSFGDRFLTTFRASHFDASRPACHTMSAGFDAYSASIQGLTYDEFTATGTPEQLAEVKAASDAIEGSASACLQPEPDLVLLDQLGAPFGLPGSVLQPLIDPTDLASAERAKGDVLTKLFAMTRSGRTRIRSMLETNDFRAFRIYTGEEQSDDFAMTILFDEGRDPRVMGRAVAALLPAAAQAACVATLDSGAVPAYGLLDPHHSSCYRDYHARAFAGHLEAGGVGIPATVIPRGRRGADAEFNPLVDRVVHD